MHKTGDVDENYCSVSLRIINNCNHNLMFCLHAVCFRTVHQKFFSTFGRGSRLKHRLQGPPYIKALKCSLEEKKSKTKKLHRSEGIHKFCWIHHSLRIGAFQLHVRSARLSKHAIYFRTRSYLFKDTLMQTKKVSFTVYHITPEKTSLETCHTSHRTLKADSNMQLRAVK